MSTPLWPQRHRLRSVVMRSRVTEVGAIEPLAARTRDGPVAETSAPVAGNRR